MQDPASELTRVTLPRTNLDAPICVNPAGCELRRPGGWRSGIDGRREPIVSVILLHGIATGCNPDRMISHRSARSAGMRTSGDSPDFA